MPAFRAMVRLSELSVKYFPCPVHKRAPPNPFTIETAYKTQALGIKKETINALKMDQNNYQKLSPIMT